MPASPNPTDYDCLKHGTPFVPFLLLKLPPRVTLTIPTTLLPIHSLNRPFVEYTLSYFSLSSQYSSQLSV